jgi:hypothetical protein
MTKKVTSTTIATSLPARHHEQATRFKMTCILSVVMAEWE